MISPPTLRKHLLLLVAISAIPAFALIAYSGLEQYAQLRAHVVERATNLAHHVAREQDRLITETRLRLKALASIPEIGQRDFQACTRKFAEQLKLSPTYFNFLFATADGDVVCSGIPQKGGQNIANRPHFRHTMRTAEFAIAQVRLDEIGGNMVLAMSAPVLDREGRAAGVVFASVPLSWYGEIAEEAGVPRGYSMSILDHEFNLLARSPPDEWIGKNISSHPLARALRATGGQGTSETAGLDGEDRFFAFAALRGAGGADAIHVALAAPTRVVYAEARMELARDVIGLLVAVVIVMLGALFGADRLVLRHVNRLVDAARKFTAGDRSVRIAEPGGIREIVALEHAFNDTAATLEGQMMRVERLNRIYSLLSAINRAIVRIRERQTLLDEVCRIAVEIGGFAAAWVAVAEPETRSVKFAAFAGISKRLVQQLDVSLDPDNPRGRGMTATALRRNAQVILNSLAGDPGVAPWRNLLESHGLRSGAAFPIRAAGSLEAVLSLYARDEGFFDAEEIALLQELAADAGLALEFMRKEERLHELSYFDRLTGLPNRTLCEDRLGQAIKRIRFHERNVGLLIVRINRFRQINDIAGWLGGDTVLKEVAAYIQKSLRDGDTVARHGDNEFAVILSDVRDAADVVAVTDKLLSGFPRVILADKSEIVVTVSAGIAIYPTDASGALDLMQKAQFALDSVPADGRTAFTFYSRATDEKAHQRHRIEGELFRALERGELELHYQPIHAVGSRQPEGAEALLRWTNSELGRVSPGVFIPIAEETGLIVPIGYWLLEKACLQLREWRDRGLPRIKVSVNVSVAQLREADFLQRVAEILLKTGFDASSLSLGMEITESELMENVDHSVSVLDGLRRLGIALSIDDFGTGYSSLSYLRELPIQTLKIDISFIRSLATNPDAVAVTKGIVALAHGLALDLVAEGVETEEQLAVLRDLGCERAQGFLFSPALPAAEFEKFLRQKIDLAGAPPSPVKEEGIAGPGGRGT